MFGEGGGIVSHCAACSACAALTPTARRRLSSASCAAATRLAVTCKLRAALNISEGGAMQAHCAASSACAALTSTASRWLPSASSAAATVPAVTRKLRRALNVSACAKRVSFEQKGGGGCYESCAACSAVRALTCPSNTAVGRRAPSSAATTSAGACEMRVSPLTKRRKGACLRTKLCCEQRSGQRTFSKQFAPARSG